MHTTLGQWNLAWRPWISNRDTCQDTVFITFELSTCQKPSSKSCMLIHNGSQTECPLCLPHPIDPSKVLQQKRPPRCQTPICSRSCLDMAEHTHGQQGSIQPEENSDQNFPSWWVFVAMSQSSGPTELILEIWPLKHLILRPWLSLYCPFYSHWWLSVCVYWSLLVHRSATIARIEERYSIGA